MGVSRADDGCGVPLRLGLRGGRRRQPSSTGSKGTAFPVPICDKMGQEHSSGPFAFEGGALEFHVEYSRARAGAVRAHRAHVRWESRDRGSSTLP